MTSATLSEITVYPIKSCAGNALSQASVTARGLQGDRSWMLVDASGRFVTGRQHPALVHVRALPIDAGLRLSGPGLPIMDIAIPDGRTRHPAQVWGSEVDAADAGDAAADWFSAYLRCPVRLVHADAAMRRALDPAYAQTGDETGFADGFPLLLLSAAAAAELSDRAGQFIDARRFRPNLLIAGVPAHVEDRWRRIRIGTVVFDVVKACTRCVFTTVDPDTGVADPGGEPLTTLKAYRRGPQGITFGQNLIPRSAGSVQVGDPVSVIEQML